MSCVRILSGGGQTPDADEVDKGWGCVTGRWLEPAVSACFPLDDFHGSVSWIKSQICPVHPMTSQCPEGHRVQHKLVGCSDLGRRWVKKGDVCAFPPSDFKVLKPSGGLKLIYQTGEGEKKIHKCVWSIELRWHLKSQPCCFPPHSSNQDIQQTHKKPN